MIAQLTFSHNPTILWINCNGMQAQVRDNLQIQSVIANSSISSTQHVDLYNDLHVMVLLPTSVLESLTWQ